MIFFFGGGGMTAFDLMNLSVTRRCSALTATLIILFACADSNEPRARCERQKDSSHSVFVSQPCCSLGYHSEPWIAVVIPGWCCWFHHDPGMINICVSSGSKWRTKQQQVSRGRCELPENRLSRLFLLSLVTPWCPGSCRASLRHRGDTEPLWKLHVSIEILYERIRLEQGIQPDTSLSPGSCYISQT